MAYILEGNVQRAGKKVHVTGQLIRTATDEHVWAKSYDRELTDIFAIQAALAQEIAGALSAALSPHEKKLVDRRATENVAAHDLYLNARALWQLLVVKLPNSQSAETSCQAAVQLDPKFAEAWAGSPKFWLTTTWSTTTPPHGKRK